MRSLSTSVRKRTMDVSFKELVASTDERTRYLKSSIATYLQGQTHLLNQSLTQTPRKRRLSRLSLGKITPKRKSLVRQWDSKDYSEEYRGAMQIGSAHSVQVIIPLIKYRCFVKCWMTRNEFNTNNDCF